MPFLFSSLTESLAPGSLLRLMSLSIRRDVSRVGRCIVCHGWRRETSVAIAGHRGHSHVRDGTYYGQCECHRDSICKISSVDAAW